MNSMHYWVTFWHFSLFLTLFLFTSVVSKLPHSLTLTHTHSHSLTHTHTHTHSHSLQFRMDNDRCQAKPDIKWGSTASFKDSETEQKWKDVTAIKTEMLLTNVEEIMFDNVISMARKHTKIVRGGELFDLFKSKKRDAPLYFYDTYRSVMSRVVDKLITEGAFKTRNAAFKRLHRIVFPLTLDSCWKVTEEEVYQDEIWPTEDGRRDHMPHRWSRAELILERANIRADQEARRAAYVAERKRQGKPEYEPTPEIIRSFNEDSVPVRSHLEIAQQEVERAHKEIEKLKQSLHIMADKFAGIEKQYQILQDKYDASVLSVKVSYLTQSL